MLVKRIQNRVPSAIPRGVAILEGYELRWHKSSKDGSGKCDVVLSSDVEAEVYGVLYEIALDEKQNLDKAEGLGAGYNEKSVIVKVSDGRVKCTVYYATSIDPALVPYSWYKALVVAGARQHELPSKYIAMLDQVLVSQDFDAVRHAENIAIAGSV